MSLRASWFSEYYHERLDVPGCFCDFMQGRNDDDLRDSISIFQEFLEDNKFTALGTKSVSPGMIRYDYLIPSKFEEEYFYIKLNGLVRLVSLKQYNELKRNDIDFEDIKTKYENR